MRLLTDAEDPWLKRVRAAAKQKGQCWMCGKDYHEESECPTKQAHQRTDALREEYYKTHLTWDELFEAWDHAIIPEAGWISISDAATAKTAAAMQTELDAALAEVEKQYRELTVLGDECRIIADLADERDALRAKGQALADAAITEVGDCKYCDAAKEGTGACPEHGVFRTALADWDA